MNRRSLGPTAALAALAFLPLALAQQVVTSPSAGREGPLQNDALVPFSSEAAKRLAEGDAALGAIDARVLSGTEPPNEATRRALLRAVEGWAGALASAAPGDAVPLDLSPWLQADGFRWPDPEGSAARRSEAVEYAVLRRVALLPASLRAAWLEREGPVAAQAFADAGARDSALECIEHLHPGTRGAALASLRLFELAFERGRPAIARSWLARATLHARVAGEADVEAAADTRAARLAALEGSLPTSPAWESALRLRAVGDPVPIPPPGPKGLRASPATPGLAFLSGGRIALHFPELVWIVDPAARDRGFEPAVFADSLGLGPVGPTSGPDAPWTHAPATDGEHLFLVEGRAGALPLGAARREGATDRWRSNMLLCATPPAELGLPELHWALGPFVHARSDGTRTPLEDALGPGMWEFQHGPALAGNLLLVQARQWLREESGEAPEVASPGEARIWMLALDAADGSVVWKRFLARGTDLVPDFGMRQGRQFLVRTAAQPLVVVEGYAFAGTNLGLGLLVDLADGRLAWSFANRRRDPESAGWRCLRAPPLGEGGGGARAALWAPSDSDHLYWLRLAPDLTGAGLLLHPPQPIGEGEELVGGDLERALVLGRSGARRTLASLEPESGRRLDSFYLNRSESFVTGALASPQRALFASDRGLYLVDLERELYLLQELPLELELDFPAGGLHADERAVWLLADRKLWRFEVDG